MLLEVDAMSLTFIVHWFVFESIFLQCTPVESYQGRQGYTDMAYLYESPLHNVA